MSASEGVTPRAGRLVGISLVRGRNRSLFSWLQVFCSEARCTGPGRRFDRHGRHDNTRGTCCGGSERVRPKHVSATYRYVLGAAGVLDVVFSFVRDLVTVV